MLLKNTIIWDVSGTLHFLDIFFFFFGENSLDVLIVGPQVFNTEKATFKN